jgi:hypothetical protein
MQNFTCSIDTVSTTYCDTVHVSDNKVMAQPRMRVEWRRQPTIGFWSESLALG